MRKPEEIKAANEKKRPACPFEDDGC